MSQNDIIRIKIDKDYIEYQKWEIELYEYNNKPINTKQYLWSSYFKIPNKPLQLYSAQEEIDLLKLLTKLK